MAGPDSPVGMIDALVHHAPTSEAEIAAYLPSAWREFLGHPGSLPGGGGMMPFTPGNPYRNPAGDKLSDARPDRGPAGSSPQLLKQQALDGAFVARAVLAHDSAMLVPAHPNHHLGRELVRAINDWSIDRWLSDGDARLYGLILVQNQLPDAAASEIRRLGSNPRMAGVLMGGNGLGKPFGHPVYHPIYEAAQEFDLPVVIRAGADNPVDTLSEATAAGAAFTYAEAHLLAPHAVITHAVSLIGQGVFVKLPRLKVLLAGAGVTWVQTVAWRFDNEFRALRREVPWLSEAPSAYMLRHLRVTTYPLDGVPGPGAWAKVFNALPGLEDMAVFASGYPNWDSDTPSRVAEQLPAHIHNKVFMENATDLFRWPRRNSATGAPAASGRTS